MGYIGRFILGYGILPTYTPITKPPFGCCFCISLVAGFRNGMQAKLNFLTFYCISNFSCIFNNFVLKKKKKKKKKMFVGPCCCVYMAQKSVVSCIGPSNKYNTRINHNLLNIH